MIKTLLNKPIRSLTAFILTFITISSVAQFANKKIDTYSKPIVIKWVDSISGDFSFTNQWSYKIDVEKKADGKAGCADGGFCPDRCYKMLDSNGIVLKDSSNIFYQLLDTTHQFHTIKCEAWCYEWAGTDFIRVFRKSNGNIFCYTPIGIATHCSLQLYITQNICKAGIELTSIIKGGDATYYCDNGYISIDKHLWENGIMKAEFSFHFKNKEKAPEPMYWKGIILTKIDTFNNRNLKTIYPDLQ